ncbi:MAG: hypothetical protein A2008_12950 [Candidatus Wallbacteria bacterium GWC2_49_35]|uniref:Uncharacterized protein n=1 Tax=Candidatus Wallbacteria bacterium GWC2_49_35 TaxID=1817813 RepID=A0A1F7WFZ6_9BACT|nr:MAG: hypothetical protein A2008_12950 [Candidatus Wallbacteria bacterium GWC2_49_35]HBC75737.1 hypothetical protein [Candidatus Wallbacteria bacterium]
MRKKKKSVFLFYALLAVFSVLIPLDNASPALPDLSTPFTQMFPQIKINNMFDSSVPIHQGLLYTFQFNKSDLESSLTGLLKSKARALNLPDENDFRAQVIRVNSVKWIILNFDGTKITLNDQMPDLVAVQGAAGDIDVSAMRYVFDTPTDPMDESMILCVVDYEWNAYFGANPINGWPKTQEAWGKFAFTIVDSEPPHNAQISPKSIFATCGDKISSFNDIIRKESLGSKYAQNPGEIVITVIDDNPFGVSEQSKLKHNVKNVDGFIMVETYNEKYRQYDYNNPPKQPFADPFELDSTIYEYLDDSTPNNGKFSWLGPFQISKIPGVSIKNVKLTSKVNAKDNVAYVISVPLEGLEAEIERSAGAGKSKMPLNYASMSDFVPVDANSALEYKSRGAKALRITFAACDSSSNWIAPDPSIINDNAAYNALIGTISAIAPPAVGKFKYNTHQLQCSLYVLDNRRPNPVIVMTNTETNHTDIFCVANSDLSPTPYSDNAAVWEFDYAGLSDTMRKLSAAERDRFKTALTVSEDVRLLFKVLAYDNVNKSVVRQEVNLSHGICTPLITGAANNRDSMRFVTWKIIDPQCLNKELNTETIGGSEFSVFPEYIFRNPDPAKGQYIELTVSDTSPFRSPPANINDASDYNSSGVISACNQRKIKLSFDIVQRSVSVSNMGSDVKTKTSGDDSK